MSPEDIDKLTIADVRAIAERASDALRTLRELGLAAPLGGAGFGHAVPQRPGSAVVSVAPQQPFPCATCHRTGPIQLGEHGGPQECIACGNPLPLTNGQRMTNKGPIGLSAEERARKLELPAFDASGEPIA